MSTNWLPLEILTYILTFTKLRDVARCAQVCRRWREAAYHGTVWQELGRRLMNLLEGIPQLISIDYIGKIYTRKKFKSTFCRFSLGLWREKTILLNGEEKFLPIRDLYTGTTKYCGSCNRRFISVDNVDVAHYILSIELTAIDGKESCIEIIFRQNMYKNGCHDETYTCWWFSSDIIAQNGGKLSMTFIDIPGKRIVVNSTRDFGGLPRSGKYEPYDFPAIYGKNVRMRILPHNL